MRLNKFIASATGMARRKADVAIVAGRVTINGAPARLGAIVAATDDICLDGVHITHEQADVPKLTVLLNKPPNYVVSRDGQGSPTVYDLLPASYRVLKPIGRLDKESSGLLLLTNDGVLAHELTHPSRQKLKVYEGSLDKPLQPLHRQLINDYGVMLDDGVSRLQLARLHDGDDRSWRITMYEGRNRQIRRTFAALGYTVTRLHRTAFGSYALGELPEGKYHEAN